MIEVTDLTVELGGIPIISRLSLRVASGEVVAVVGRSGSGKTTLLNTIAGFVVPRGGAVRVDARPASPGAVRGIVFQDDSLLGWLSVEENVLFGVRGPDKKRRDEAARILAVVGLDRVREERPGTLSAGMRRRVEFARALIADRRFMIADEPFGPLDAVTRGDVWALWSSLRKIEPRTTLFCTHDPEEAVTLSDRVVTLVGTRPCRLGAEFRVADFLSLSDRVSLRNAVLAELHRNEVTLA